MSNILAIAHKELKAYFASPIAYIVIGFSAILFGWFFVNLLYYFDRMSLQAGMGMGGPDSVNVNEMLIGPLFMNVSVILLFTLPLITMRIYSEEKRSGTIELLLTAPLTDFQIVMGKFIGALVLSEFTGAAAELRQAYLVNPHDLEGVKDVIEAALNQTDEEGRRRMRSLRRQVLAHDVDRWARSFLDALSEAHPPGTK